MHRNEETHGGHGGGTNEHTGEISFKDGKVKKVKDKNGNEVPGSTSGPEGKIASIECISLVRIHTEDPSGQCWVFYNGRWYRWC